MRRLSLLALLGLLAFSPGIARAQLSGPMEVDANEVRRRGDMVQHVGGDDITSSDPHVMAFMQITELPANDNDKWFLYVIGQKNCPACDRLKQQWQTDAILLAYANPKEPKGSWAHFTWYYLEDKLQAFRWDKTKNPHALDVKATPTIVCQPPRSGKYGDSGTVVHQEVYDGNPQAFAQRLNSSIKKYCEYLERRGALPEQKAAGVPSFGNEFQPTPVQNGGLWNVAPEQVAKYAVATNEPAVASGPQGFGQQTVPPLDLPNEPKPDQQPAGPLRNTVQGWFNPGEIVVVRDAQELPSEETEQAVKDTVEELQPDDQTLKVRQVPVENNPWGVKPEETPVVLKVRGKDVIEKLSVDPNQEKGFVSLILIPLALALFGGYSTMHIIGGIIKFMVIVVIIFAILIVVIFAGSRYQPKPAVAPQGVPPLSPEEVAALKAQLAASTSKTQAAAAKVAPE